MAGALEAEIAVQPEGNMSSGSETSVLDNLFSAKESNQNSVTVANGSIGPSLLKKSDVDSAKLKPALASVKEDSNSSETVINSSPSRKADGTETLEAILRKTPSSSSSSSSSSGPPARPVRKWDFATEVLLKDTPAPKPPSSPRKKESRTIPSATQKGLERLLESHNCDAAGPGRPTTSSHRELTLEALKESLARPTTTSTRYTSAERKQGVILESMHPSEVRAMSGMLSNLVRSASRSRGYTLSSSGLKELGRISTPEGRLMVSHSPLYLNKMIIFIFMIFRCY